MANVHREASSVRDAGVSDHGGSFKNTDAYNRGDGIVDAGTNSCNILLIILGVKAMEDEVPRQGRG